MKRKKTSALAVLGLATLIACAVRQPGDQIRPGFNMFSKEQDVQLGREAEAQVRQQVEVVNNPGLQQYVSTLGQQLARQPEADQYPYKFTMVNDRSINAFALPGGPIYVHSGLISAAENEAQVAGVLSHEIAHVALRHSTNQVSKANIAQLPAAIASATVGEGSIVAQLAQVGIGIGFNSLLLKYSRDAENQADALGARMMSKAGYNPIEMARFFEQLEKGGGSRAPQFLSSHPNPGNRVKAVEAEIPYIPKSQYNANTGQFQNAKSAVGQLPPPSRRMSGD